MNLYHVKISSNSDASCLHAELVMTESCETALNSAWSNFLADISEKSRASISMDDVSFIVEEVTDVTALGAKHSVYYTNDSLK